MTRQEMLNDYLREVRRARLRPGLHDCGLFGAGWVQRITGVDHAAPWRGKYRSIEDGLSLVTSAGHESYGAYVASLLPEIAPAMAQVGDIALLDDGRALGVFASDRVFVLRPDGLGHVSRMKAERAFKV